MGSAKHHRRVPDSELENLTEADWNHLFQTLGSAEDPHLGQLLPYLKTFYAGSRGIATNDQLTEVLHKQSPAEELGDFGHFEVNQFKRQLRDHGLTHVKIRDAQTSEFEASAYRIRALPMRMRMRMKR